MLGNSIALTITLGLPVIKHADFDHLITQFHKIDENLVAIGHQIDYRAHLHRSKVITIGYLGLLGVSLSYDFYITVDKYQMISVWYWLVSATPLLVYSIGLYHAMFMIYWIKYRCSLINKVLKGIRPNEGLPEKLPFLHLNIESNQMQVQPREKLIPQGVVNHISGGVTLGKRSRLLQVQRPQIVVTPDMNTLSQLFSIMNDLCKLSRKVDEYYGIFFLVSIGALFAITSIQVFYCYVTASIMDHARKYSVWSLMVSVNLVTVNLSLIVGITTVCESVSNEATKILQNFSALQIKQDVVSDCFVIDWTFLRLQLQSFAYIPSTAHS